MGLFGSLLGRAETEKSRAFRDDVTAMAERAGNGHCALFFEGGYDIPVQIVFPIAAEYLCLFLHIASRLTFEVGPQARQRLNDIVVSELLPQFAIYYFNRASQEGIEQLLDNMLRWLNETELQYSLSKKVVAKPGKPFDDSLLWKATERICARLRQILPASRIREPEPLIDYVFVAERYITDGPKLKALALNLPKR